MSLDREVLPVREAYDRWAPHYDHDANPLVALDELVVPRLVGAVRGLRIADLGCGTGRHTIRLASAGARVTAVDFSRNMLEEANRRLAGHAVTFVEHDLTKPLPFDDAAFDGVLSCLALEHIADVAAFFREARRVCKPGGGLVVTDMHPAMRLRGVQANFDDIEAMLSIRVQGYEHPVSEYVTAALAAGLAIESIEEHKGNEALVDRSPRMAKYVGWPMLVAMRARR
jgi:ubiquinone/menaquinone biosynthesis C-methylase UbiE